MVNFRKGKSDGLNLPPEIVVNKHNSAARIEINGKIKI